MHLPSVLIHYLMLVLTAGVCVYLFLSVKRELRRIETRSLRRGEALRTELRELADELETVRRELELREQNSDRGGTLGRTLGPAPRIQALGMIRRGEGPEQIVSALKMPRAEVELLIKVQELTGNDGPAPTIGRAAG